MFLFKGLFIIIILVAFETRSSSSWLFKRRSRNGKPNTPTIDEMIERSGEAEAMDGYQPDGTMMMELDMKLTMPQYNEIMSMRNRRKRRKATIVYRRWTDKTIPYELANDFSTRDIQEIRNAIGDWNRFTCLTIRPKTSSDTNYVHLKNSNGCWSYVGMQGGKQDLGLASGCRSKGIIMHELGHALGFQHEQTRPNRDEYVTIRKQYIKAGKEHNFQKYSMNEVNSYDVPYDYLSIMHYGSTAFSKNGQCTIVCEDYSYQWKIGRRDRLSFNDIKLANLMYDCDAGCGYKYCGNKGFVGKDCNCYCPGSENDPIHRC